LSRRRLATTEICCTVAEDIHQHQTVESGDFGEFIAHSEGGSFWLIRSIDMEPEATLQSWSVRATPKGQRHFCGRTIEGSASQGRVSSPIIHFDPARKRGRTVTGRVYQLRGPAGSSPDVDYLWQRWLRINGFSDWTDATPDVPA
jgi:hypothetical protein